ncbi:MAG TPA: PRC-barrel domain-containing protein [Xanthobacteraceae bacterium]
MIKRILVTSAIGAVMISGSLAQSTKIGDQSTNISDAPKFVAAQSSDQWVFSKFKGTDVVGPNDESIGGVNDMLFDKSGKILGIVVGVGGFLGLGQKNVAIDMSAFQAVPAGSGNTRAPVTGGANDPTNIKLKVVWTKDELQKAPDFEYFKPPSDTASGTRPSTNGIGQRPNPMQPAPAPQTR